MVWFLHAKTFIRGSGFSSKKEIRPLTPDIWKCVKAITVTTKDVKNRKHWGALILIISWILQMNVWDLNTILRARWRLLSTSQFATLHMNNNIFQMAAIFSFVYQCPFQNLFNDNFKGFRYHLEQRSNDVTCWLVPAGLIPNTALHPTQFLSWCSRSAAPGLWFIDINPLLQVPYVC